MRVHAVYEDFFDYLLDHVSAGDILTYNVPASAKKRAEELLVHKSAGTITPEELEELRQLGEFDVLLAALKAKALARIDS